MSERGFVAAILLAGVFATGCASAPPRAGSATDVAAIRKVVEDFRQSILRKDKATFMGLFFSDQPERIAWQAVVDDAALATIRATRPEAIKARYRPDNNFVAFIDGIVASKDREEEAFGDLDIDTDGEVASVSFDYAYLSNGRTTNFGREKWLLVRVEAGWKILSVAYTIRFPQAGG